MEGIYYDFDFANELTWHELSDPILHIELRRWAHLLLIAPTSANTLAKIANGLCDNLLVPHFRDCF